MCLLTRRIALQSRLFTNFCNVIRLRFFYFYREMEELFDPFEGYTFPSGSLIFNKNSENPETNVPNYEQIIDQLCQIAGDEDEELKNEIASLDQQCRSLDNNRTNENIQNSQVCNGSELKLTDPPDVGEILATDEASISPTSHNVGIINSACQQVLKEIEQQLLSLLKKNRKEQEIVQNFLNTNGKCKYNETNKKINIKCAGIPYFKDLNGYLPPPNQDVLRKRRKHKLTPIDLINSSPMWSRNDAKNLTKAVNAAIAGNIDVESIDWMKISATDMDGKYSPSECKSKWFMNLRPGINRSRWSSKEVKLLNSLAEKYNYQDWDRIAEELGTNRTGLQCCVQYQTHRAPTGKKWTKEEDESLKQMVEKYKAKDYIPWPKVAWHFEHRSLRQCMERYAYHLGNIKKGGFSVEEDFVIVYLAKKLKNFGEVAKYLPQRVSTQVRARYEYLVRSSMPDFSKEEDELLTKLVMLYPRNWAKISEYFQNRSKLQCRGRWASIQKKIKLETEITSDTELDERKELANPAAILNESDKDTMDVVTLKKNINSLVRPGKNPKQKKKPKNEANKLLEYHKYCFKFLFGPKPRIPNNSEECDKLANKMRITMGMLSVESTARLSHNIESLSKNCEFDEEDRMVLNRLIKPGGDENEKIEIINKVIPPNYMTLVGLRTLTLGWNKIRTLCANHNDLVGHNVNEDIDPADRILCNDAKKLFKSRMKSLFTFPLILSNISLAEVESNPVCPTKVKKKPGKPLSKRKRKQHAKYMSQTYRNKIQKNLNEKLIKTDKPEIVVSDHEQDPEESVARKKKGRQKRERKIKKESNSSSPKNGSNRRSKPVKSHVVDQEENGGERMKVKSTSDDISEETRLNRKRGRPCKVVHESDKNEASRAKKSRKVDP